MKSLYIQAFDQIIAKEESKKAVINILLDYTNHTKQGPDNKQKKRWGIRRIAVAATTAAVMLFCAVFIPVAVIDGSVIESGFEISDNNNDVQPSYPYFQVYSAHRFSTKKLDINNVTIEFFYGHLVPDSLKNAVSETKITIEYAGWRGADDRTIEIKNVDNFLSDEYLLSIKRINQYRKKVIFNHSEIINIPKEAFVAYKETFNKNYGQFYLCVRTNVTDESAELFYEGEQMETRGWGYSGWQIYYRIENDKVVLGEDSSVFPKDWNVGGGF